MEGITNREVIIVATIHAPVDDVWNAWTKPEHLTHWWGPAGFTTTIHTMNLEKGGEWNLTLHGPDGTNFPNRSVFLEIIPLRKISFEHFNPHFITTVHFQAVGDHTSMDWTLLFDTAEMRDIVVKAHKAEEGQRQNVERLEKYLSEMQSASSLQQ
jgi:uncharacterized protein YndB with AHSA1/START domain